MIGRQMMMTDKSFDRSYFFERLERNRKLAEQSQNVQLYQQLIREEQPA
jgi:hypothetical protein